MRHSSWMTESLSNVMESRAGSIDAMKTGSSGTDIKARDGEPDSKKFRDLWVQCENCYGLNYKKNFK
ncbi:hypothetical protein QJS10_CPA03g01325 [Acorus calamus]|uniref:Uncharacterized protein n=1 Tax=Acorus calamus TaxID=4465 RepID=A0AAV9F6B9_ACOCL|nr:hypothetical protein QJS10_CPA03g01325 [Acorus calamus]